MSPTPYQATGDADRPEEAIRLRSVRAGYRREPDTLIDISFVVRPRETALVAGGPGSGKTTLLHLLRGAIRPRGGEAGLLGLNFTTALEAQRQALRRRIGYIARSPRLIENATTFTNIAAPDSCFQVGGALDASVAANARELMAFLGLLDVAGNAARTLSDTQRRLVGLARTILVRPAILLADEPVAALPAETKSRVFRLLSEIARQGGAIVIATQTPETYAPFPQTPWRMELGRLSAGAG